MQLRDVPTIAVLAIFSVAVGLTAARGMQWATGDGLSVVKVSWQDDRQMSHYLAKLQEIEGISIESQPKYAVSDDTKSMTVKVRIRNPETGANAIAETMKEIGAKVHVAS